MKDRKQMTNNLNAPIIGIDRGASFTDLAVIDTEGVKEFSSLENRDWQPITAAYEELIKK